MFIADIYKTRIEPRLNELRQALIDGKERKDIMEEFDVTEHEWKTIKKTYPEVISIIEEVKGERSDYYKKVVPRFDDIEGFIYEGLNQKEIANRLGVSSSTLKIYKGIYPEFEDFLNECYDIANNRVVGAAYKRAIGYNYEEKKEMIEEGEQLFDKEGEPIYLKDQDGNFILKNGKKVPKRKPGKVKVEKITKHMSPDSNMISFWLTNRDPSNWSSRRDNSEVFDPLEAAKVIRETIKTMDSTVPITSHNINYADVLSNLPKLNISQLNEISKIIEDTIDIKRDYENKKNLK